MSSTRGAAQSSESVLSGHGVEVVEPPTPARVRRPADLARLILAVLLLVVTIVLADIAVGTAGALERDLFGAIDGLPRLLMQLLGWISGFGVLLLPVVLGIDLLIRKRPWQLAQAVIAAAVAAAITIALLAVVNERSFTQIYEALTRYAYTGRTSALSPVIVILTSFLTVCRVTARRWHQGLAVLVLLAAIVPAFFGGASTALSLFVSLLLGWAIGLAFRFALGATSTLPTGALIADSLVDVGLPLTRLVLQETEDDNDRRYAGELASGAHCEVTVIDRDTFGIASARGLSRRLRLRGTSTRMPALSVRAEAEHRALVALTLEKIGVSAPRLLASASPGPFSAALAFIPDTGRTLQDAGIEVTDEELRATWALLQRLQSSRFAHRSLTADNVILSLPEAGLARIGNGDIAAHDIPLRLDIAELLVSIALTTGADRAVRSAVDALGTDRVRRALPVLQRMALGSATRSALRHHRGLLGELNDRLIALEPEEPVPSTVELRRVTPKGVVTVLGGAIAAYLLLGQLAQVNVGELIAQANWGWALACVGCTILTFAGPSISIAGAVQVRLRFAKTYATQLAVAFSGLVAPAAIGNIALNTRYLVKSGVPIAVAGTSVGLVQAAQFLSYVVLLLITGVLTGTGTGTSFSPSPKLVAAASVVLVIMLILLAIPKVRSLISDKVMPQVRTVIPEILKVLQSPGRLFRLIFGSLVLDTMFVGALYCAMRSLGGEAPLPAVAVVYFAGAIIGSAVPTPGGIGGIEVAMSSGLIAIGVPAAIALPAVLLYRFITYWLPIPFGWYSLNRLQTKGDL